MSQPKVFNLPDVGEGLTEAEIVKWHVQAGDTVEINQTIVEIETAKAIVELPCPFEGVVTELHVAEGQTVDVGAPIISVDAEGGAAPEPARPAEPARRAEEGVPTPDEPGMVSPEQPPKRQPVLVGYGVKEAATKRRPRKASNGTAPAAPAPAPAAPVVKPPAVKPPAPRPQPVDNGLPLAKPPVRKMAKDLGVDLATIKGSGPQGSITREDVQAALSAPAAPAVQAGPREERVPVKGVRKATAAAMSASAFTAPHVTEFLQVDVTRTMETVKRLRELPEFADVKVSPLLLVARALLTAVARNPMVNSSWADGPDGAEIVVKRYVNLGIAAATERGLIVPKVKDAQDLDLPGLARALAELTEKARAGKATPADLSDGTITITNVGVFGVDSGTPILTPGESAILAFGQIRDMPWVHEGELAIRKVTTLSLSFDHRIVDGELGSKVLRDVGAMLEDPIRMLAWS
ncbi:dihydrolipoamide acetyltransferase family protein [Actinomadura chibensis]|uniref:Dihydrolipoamide acetyltransferase component of pyruvate dehydrogenase complex n=1 Tax=Actinomadura chibensis TaxID=392828 RepID=A0A5D0NY12_9ACTN|nr:dihydrolipoamide acetyltransferase family protein [Actinomadura chibensis]TYB49058.1 2-oxo acid dehydrogenase subunit E2 [Actinomadura chibensis]